MSKSKQHFVLSNGMQIITTPLKGSKMASIFMRIKTGSLFEGPYLGTGISHLLEHSVFLGSASLPDKDQFSLEIEKMGGIDLNAYTTYDHTSYFFSVFAENLGKALQHFKDFLFRPRLLEKDVKNEMGSILSEMDMIEDKPDYCFYEFIAKHYFGHLPYAYPIIGGRKIFQSLDIKALKHYHQSTYQPKNMILSVAGNLDREKSQSLIAKVFDRSDLKSNNALPPLAQRQESWQPLPQRAPITAQTHHQKTLFPKLTLLYRSTDFDDVGHVALDLLPFFLTSDNGSFLIDLLKEKQKLVKDLSSYSFSPKAYGADFGGAKEKGYFAFSFELPNDLKTKAALKKRIDQVIASTQKILTDIVSCSLKTQDGKKLESLLEGAKNALLKEFIEEKESPMEVASSLSTSMHYRKNLTLEKFYFAEVKKFNVRSIKETIKKYLLKQKPDIFLLLNENFKGKGNVLENTLSNKNFSNEVSLNKVLLQENISKNTLRNASRKLKKVKK